MNSEIKKLLFACPLIALFSCSGDEQQKTQLKLFQPDAIRQVLAYDSSNLVVEVLLNSERLQTFSIDAASGSPVVEISGVRREQENEIMITWIEVVDGRKIELSQQSQVFVADGNTIIDAPHSYSQFDYDNDSASNFSERLAGTCVWTRSETCDVSTAEPQVLAGTNLLLNGDFSQGRTSWFADGDGEYSLAGEYCVTSPAVTYHWESQIGYVPLIPLSGDLEYVVSLKIKADSNSTARVILNNVDNGYFTILDQQVSVSTSYENKRIPVTLFGDWPNVRLTINFGNPQVVRYCIDDVVLGVSE